MPDAQLSWIVNDSLASVLRFSADVDDILLFRRKEWGSPLRFPAFVGFLRELHRRPFDLVVDFQGLFRSGLLTGAASAPRKVGFAAARELAHIAYTEKVPVPDGMTHAIDKNLHLLGAALGEECAYEAPSFRPDPALEAEADALLAASGMTGAPLLAVGPVSRWPSKNWPPAFFAETIRRVLADGLPNLRVWLLGAPGDLPAGEAIMAGVDDPRLVCFMGRTSLPLMITLLRRSRLLLSNDSGPMHIAAALSVPTVALFGPTDPAKTRPYGPGHQVFQTKVPCAPCFQRVCPLPEQLCLSDVISPERISGYITQRLTHADTASPVAGTSADPAPNQETTDP